MGRVWLLLPALLGGFGLFALKIFLINVIFMKGHCKPKMMLELVSYERGHSVSFYKNK
nr:hypothetical protein [Mycoplasmopsis bovis]